MTREEAIDILYGIKADNLNLDDAYIKDKYEALGMAISALEQMPEVTSTMQTGQFDYVDKRTPCSMCRFINDNSGLCDMCPAMPFERGAE